MPCANATKGFTDFSGSNGDVALYTESYVEHNAKVLGYENLWDSLGVGQVTRPEGLTDRMRTVTNRELSAFGGAVCSDFF